MFKLKYQFTDFLFRSLFSLIFIALGFEHLFQDQLIQLMMPYWIVNKHLFSLAAGVVLLGGGFSLLIGYKVRLGATILGLFLVLATILIHIPGVMMKPAGFPQEWGWLWDVYQRSNLIKNLCLLGGCFHLTNHKLGRFSLEYYLLQKHKEPGA
jgi:uncharacterized membrane protein YphA (DoxX/SURF4 family)